MKIALIILIFTFSMKSLFSKDRPYHHVYENGKFVKFRNFEGAPERDKDFKWSFKRLEKRRKILM